MTVQYIIIGLIIASAAGSAVFRFIRSVIKPVNKCAGCAASCGGCAIQELKKRKAG